MSIELINAVRENQAKFGLELSEQALGRLGDYYALVQDDNPILHLVGPCTPETFATRHILESLTMLEFLPENANLVDVGSGGGLPALPCLLVRDDLNAILVESKAKKAAFLQHAVDKLGLSRRTRVENKQFGEVILGSSQFVSCRALDKFSEHLPRMLKWAERRNLLLFGGPAIQGLLQDYRIKFVQRLMPLSEQRFLFFSKR